MGFGQPPASPGGSSTPLPTQAPPRRQQQADYRQEMGTVAAAETFPAGTPTTTRQFKALVTKRVQSSKRDKWRLAIQLFPPVLFTLIALIVVKVSPGARDLPARSSLNLAQNYGNAYVAAAGFDASQADAGSDDDSQLFLQALQHNVKVFGGKESLTLISADESGNAVDMAEWILGAANGSAHRTAVFNRRNPVALELGGGDEEEGGGLTAWFNGQGYHSVTEALSLASILHAAPYFSETPTNNAAGGIVWL